MPAQVVRARIAEVHLEKKKSFAMVFYTFPYQAVVEESSLKSQAEVNCTYIRLRSKSEL